MPKINADGNLDISTGEYDDRKKLFAAMKAAELLGLPVTVTLDFDKFDMSIWSLTLHCDAPDVAADADQAAVEPKGGQE